MANFLAPVSALMSTPFPSSCSDESTPPTSLFSLSVLTPELSQNGKPHNALILSRTLTNSMFMRIPLPGTSELSNSSGVKYLISAHCASLCFFCSSVMPARTDKMVGMSGDFFSPVADDGFSVSLILDLLVATVTLDGSASLLVFHRQHIEYLVYANDSCSHRHLDPFHAVL